VLRTDKKKACTGYKKAKEAMRELMTVKANVDSLIGLNAARNNREETRAEHG